MHRPAQPDADAQPDWFRRAFDTLYPLIYQHRGDESANHEITALVETLRWQPGGSVGRGRFRGLDIACGAGRHLRALRDAGFEAMGMDLSMALLREAAAQRQLRGCVVCGDVRAMPFAAAFDFAVNLFNSFGYFADDAENLAALRSMAGVLRPGGTLVMEHINPRKLKAELVPMDVKQVGELTVESRRTIEHDRVCKRMTIRRSNGDEEQITECVRLFSPDELAEWFTRAGLHVARVMGSFDGAVLRDDSPRMLMVGVRV
ncbi:MAG: class I SAM-dependent methyltransferase [Phycisphaerales bacterium]